MIAIKYCTNINYLIKEIQLVFQGFGYGVHVGGKDTIELYDVNYTLFMKDYPNMEVQKFKFDEEAMEVFEPAKVDDEIERFKFFGAIQKFCDNELKNDPNSRQCVIQQKYNDDKNLASCVSFMQLIKRYNVLDLHITIRSQNFSHNFVYDNYTFYKCLKLASEKTGIECGAIHIKIVSLHIIL